MRLDDLPKLANDVENLVSVKTVLELLLDTTTLRSITAIQTMCSSFDGYLKHAYLIGFHIVNVSSSYSILLIVFRFLFTNILTFFSIGIFTTRCEHIIRRIIGTHRSPFPVGMTTRKEKRRSIYMDFHWINILFNLWLNIKWIVILTCDFSEQLY